jgi:hypothetical protein
MYNADGQPQVLGNGSYGKVKKCDHGTFSLK